VVLFHRVSCNFPPTASKVETLIFSFIELKVALMLEKLFFLWSSDGQMFDSDTMRTGR